MNSLKYDLIIEYIKMYPAGLLIKILLIRKK